MAGRRGTPPRAVGFAQVPAVDDPKVQRALDVLSAAVQELQARAPGGGSSAVFTATRDGLAPASGGGTSNFLRADGTWAAPPSGGGAVASVSAGSSKVSVSPTTGAVVVDVVPANFTGIPQAGVVNLVSDLAAKVPTSRTLTGTAPVRIDGGASADLSANRTISVANNSTSSKGVVAQAPNDTTKFWRGDATWATPLVDAGFFGFGTHGALNFDGVSTVAGIAPVNNPSSYPSLSNVYILTDEIHATDITVGAGVYVMAQQNRIFATGTITNNGFIGNPGRDAAAAGAASALPTGFYAIGTAGGTGQTTLGSNGAVGGTSGSVPRIWAAAVAGNATVTGQGGKGGDSNSGLGGLGGPLNQVSVSGFSLSSVLQGARAGGNFGSTCTAGSGGGGGGNGSGGSGTSSSGGGGGGGGYLFLGARHITGSGRFSCKGGNGGPAGGSSLTMPAGGGGGGGGGFLVIVYSTASGTWTYDAAGGAGGTGRNGGGNGNDGAAGTAVCIPLSG